MVRILTATLVAMAGAGLAMAHPVGTLAGRVRDERGLPLAGASITVTGRGAVGIYHAATGSDGFYSIVGLPTLEPLEVTAVAMGRVPVTYSGAVVRVGAVTMRDFAVRPAGLHDVLVIYEERLPYHAMALEGVRETPPGALTLLELGDDARADLRLLREVLGRRFNAVITLGSRAARIARREIRDAPVIYAMVLDPAAEDLLRINLCGLTLNGAYAEQLEVLAGLRPTTELIGTIYDPRRLAGAVEELRRAAHARGIRLAARSARSTADVIAALEDLSGQPLDAFFLLLDPDLFDTGGFERVRRFAAGRDMIFVVPDPSFVAVGGTFSYGPGFREMGAYAARLVTHLFSGAAEPADIDVRFPPKRTLTLNPFEMRRLDLTLPDEWSRGTDGSADMPAGAIPR